MPTAFNVSGSSLSRYGRSTASACFGRPSSESSIARWRSTLSPPAPLAEAFSKARSTPSRSPTQRSVMARCRYPSFIFGFSATTRRAIGSASSHFPRSQRSLIVWSVWSTPMSVFGSSAGPYDAFISSEPVRYPRLLSFAASSAPMAAALGRRRRQLEKALAEPAKRVGRPAPRDSSPRQGPRSGCRARGSAGRCTCPRPPRDPAGAPSRG